MSDTNRVVSDFIETCTALQELNKESHWTIEIGQVVLDRVPWTGRVAPLAVPVNRNTVCVLL